MLSAIVVSLGVVIGKYAEVGHHLAVLDIVVLGATDNGFQAQVLKGITLHFEIIWKIDNVFNHFTGLPVCVVKSRDADTSSGFIVLRKITYTFCLSVGFVVFYIIVIYKPFSNASLACCHRYVPWCPPKLFTGRIGIWFRWTGLTNKLISYFFNELSNLLALAQPATLISVLTLVKLNPICLIALEASCSIKTCGFVFTARYTFGVESRTNEIICSCISILL